MARTLTHEVQEHGVYVNITDNGKEQIDTMFPTVAAFIENAITDLDEELNIKGHSILTTAEKQIVKSWTDALK